MPGGQLGQQPGVHLSAVGVGDGFALGDFGQLAHHAANDDFSEALGHGFIERIARKSPICTKQGGADQRALSSQTARCARRW